MNLTKQSGKREVFFASLEGHYGHWLVFVQNSVRFESEDAFTDLNIGGSLTVPLMT